MLFEKIRNTIFEGAVLRAALLCAFLLIPAGIISAQGEAAEKELQTLKAAMETTKPATTTQIREYNRLYKIISDCSPTGQIIKTFRAEGDPFAPLNNLCVNGALAVSDPNYNRVLTNSTGTGVGNGTVGNCSLSGSGNAVEFDVYSFNLTNCAAFPTEVTATLCGPAGCQHVGNTDTTLVMYRAVAAGDALTANGGLPAAFNPASACTNAVAASDDIGSTAGAATNTGGATCNQTATTQCLTPCTTPSAAGGLSGLRRQIGNGRFTIVIGGFGNTTTGSYNLYVDAPAAGCNVAIAPSAANGEITGRALTMDGRGLGMAQIIVSGGTLATPITVLTNPFGYYTLSGLEAGNSYALSVSAKGRTFTNPTQIITLQGDIANVDFTAVD